MGRCAGQAAAKFASPSRKAQYLVVLACCVLFENSIEVNGWLLIRGRYFCDYSSPQKGRNFDKKICICGWRTKYFPAIVLQIVHASPGVICCISCK